MPKRPCVRSIRRSASWQSKNFWAGAYGTSPFSHEQIQHQRQHGGRPVFLTITSQQQKQQHDDQIRRIKILRKQLLQKAAHTLALVGWPMLGLRRRARWLHRRFLRLLCWGILPFLLFFLHAVAAVRAIRLGHITIIHAITSPGAEIPVVEETEEEIVVETVEEEVKQEETKEEEPQISVEEEMEQTMKHEEEKVEEQVKEELEQRSTRRRHRRTQDEIPQITNEDMHNKETNEEIKKFILEANEKLKKVVKKFIFCTILKYLR